MSRFCTNCGQEVDDSVNFCINCGKKINNEVQTEVNKINRSNTFNPKNKIAAGLLGIFLGTFGVHNFYLGYTKKAVAQLLITVLSFGSLSFISSTWGIVEGIMILTGSINNDGNGNPLDE